MYRVKGLWIGFLFVLWPVLGHTQVQADRYKEHIARAIDAFENTPREQWAFQVSRYENEEGDVTSSLERFVPNAAPAKQWQLLQLNGQPPSDKQIQRFIEKKQATESDHTVKLRDLIQMDTLKLVEENDTHFTMSFKVQLEQLGEEASEHLTGHVTYQKARQFVERIEIANIDEFSPMFMVTVSDFQLSLTFQSIQTSVLPLESKMRLKGRMSVFTEIDEISTDAFSDYQFSPPEG